MVDNTIWRNPRTQVISVIWCHLPNISIQALQSHEGSYQLSKLKQGNC